MNSIALARGLGWFSIGLGAVEVVKAEELSDFLGIGDRSAIVRAFGFREIAAGIGILSQSKLAPWVWARVGGDFLDLASLGSALSPANREVKRTAAALGIVAGITVLDAICARQLSRKKQ